MKGKKEREKEKEREKNDTKSDSHSHSVSLTHTQNLSLIKSHRQFVSEYLGELISLKELNNRMNRLTNEQHLYAMQLNSKAYLDSRNKGNHQIICR